MLPTSNTSDQLENSTSNNLEQGTMAAAAPARQDLDSSDDELPDKLPEEFLHPGDVIGYYEGTFGDKYSYQETQITEAAQWLCDYHRLHGENDHQTYMYQCC
jgi:hypothetical protein